MIEALQKGSSLDPQNALFNFVAADVCYRSATTLPDHVSVELLYADSSPLVIHDRQLYGRGLTFLQWACEQTTYMSPHVMNSELQLARWSTDNEHQAVQHVNCFQALAIYRAFEQIFIEVVMAFRSGDYEAAKQHVIALENLADQAWKDKYSLSASSAYYLEIAGELNRQIAGIAPEFAESPAVARARQAKSKLRRAAVNRAQQGLVFNGLRQPVSQGAVAWHFASGQFGAALLLLAVVCQLFCAVISRKSNGKNREAKVSWSKVFVSFFVGTIGFTISLGLCFLGPTMYLLAPSTRFGGLLLVPAGLLVIARFTVRSPTMKRRLQIALPPAVILGCGMALLIKIQLPLLNKLWQSGAEFTPAHWLGRDVFLVNRGDLPAEFENFARFWLMNRGLVVAMLATLILAIAVSCWQSLNAKMKWREVTANALRSVASHSLESAMILIAFFAVAASMTLEKASIEYQSQKYLMSAQMQADYSQSLAKTLADPKFHAELANDKEVRKLQN